MDGDVVEIARSNRAAIDKAAAPAQLAPGDELTFTLRYANFSSTAVQSMDAIDLLPFDGDPRGSRIAPGSFTLSGMTGSGKTPAEEVAWVSADDPAGLDALDGTTDGFLDPQSAEAVGLTEWPCTFDSVVAGTCGAVTSLSQITALRFVGSPPGFLPPGSGPTP